jgi:class 3 adenylate cyclase
MSLLLDRFALFYPMRIVGTAFMVVALSLYAWQFDGFGTLYRVLVAVLVVYPHVVHYLARKYPQSRRKIELRTFVFDSFMVGVVVHAIGFGPLPTFVLITVALASALSVNGPRQMLMCAGGVLGGIVTYGLFAGFQFSARDTIAVDVASSVFTFVYFMAFAYSAHNRSALLQRSETELRERTASLEIEKLRSDRLVYNIVPARLAPQMSAAGTIVPVRHDAVVLLAIEVRRFSRALQEGPADDVLAHLMHCFRAFDAIAERFGLEKLKTMGDVYIAAGGLPTPGPGDAAAGVSAALAVREHLADLAESRRAHGKLAFEAAIAVHCGSVIAGVVETSKLSYDVFGGAMKVLLALLRGCADGDVVASDAARRLTGEAFDWAATDSASSGVRVHRVHAHDAASRSSSRQAAARP